MSIGLVQSNNGVTAAAATVVPAALLASPTANNLLKIEIAGDKDTASIAAWAAANNWNLPVDRPGASVSSYMIWKVSDGTETSVSITTAAATQGHAWLYQEWSDPAVSGGNWQVVAQSVPAYVDTTTNSRSTGTTEAATADGLAVALATIDSEVTGISGRTWSNSYAVEHDSPTSSGRAGLHVATLPVANGTTTETTWSYTGTADQVYAAVVVFSKLIGTPTAPDPQTLTISNTGGATLNWTASKTKSWLSIAPTTGTTPSGSTDDITVTVDPTGVTETDTDTITITDAAATNSPVGVPVTFTIIEAPPDPLVPRQSFEFATKRLGPF